MQKRINDTAAKVTKSATEALDDATDKVIKSAATTLNDAKDKAIKSAKTTLDDAKDKAIKSATATLNDAKDKAIKSAKATLNDAKDNAIKSAKAALDEAVAPIASSPSQLASAAATSLAPLTDPVQSQQQQPLSSLSQFTTSLADSLFSHLSSAVTLSPALEARQQSRDILAILQGVVNRYIEDIEGSTTQTEGMSLYSQSSTSTSAHFKPNGPTGVKRAKDFRERIEHQDSAQKRLNVVLHLIDKEGGNWGPNSLKTKVLEGLQGKKIGTTTSLVRKEPIITKQDGLDYIKELKVQLNNNQPEASTNFDELPKPQEQGWFSSLWNGNI